MPPLHVESSRQLQEDIHQSFASDAPPQRRTRNWHSERRSEGFETHLSRLRLETELSVEQIRVIEDDALRHLTEDHLPFPSRPPTPRPSSTASSEYSITAESIVDERIWETDPDVIMDYISSTQTSLSPASQRPSIITRSKSDSPKLFRPLPQKSIPSRRSNSAHELVSDASRGYSHTQLPASTAFSLTENFSSGEVLDSETDLDNESDTNSSFPAPDAVLADSYKALRWRSSSQSLPPDLDANAENSNIFSLEDMFLRHSGRHDPLFEKRRNEWTLNKDSGLWDTVHALLESCASLFRAESVMPDALPPEPFSRGSPLCLDGQISNQSKYIVASGGYADVWTGSLGDQIVAIKVMRPFSHIGSPIEISKLVKRLWREYVAWSRLSHPNVLDCLGFSYDFAPQTGHKTPALISRWMSNGTVISYIKTQTNVDRVDIVMDIARGLTYLHTRSPAVIHGDLRAGNVLVSPNGTACLADFGLSRLVGGSRGMTTSSEVAGSLRWMAPELLHGKGLSVQSDVWAYGMTILEIFTGTRPYSEIALDVSVLFQISKGNLPIRPQAVSLITDEVWTLCQECWKIEPAERPSITDVLATYLQR